MRDPYSTGLELILNAAEGALQIGVTDDETPACFQEWQEPRMATEILAPALKEIWGRLKIRAAEFRRVACVVGPGSFTGIRLVLATAAAMRRVTGVPLGALDYTQALATRTAIDRGLLYPAKIYVLTGARRDLVHFRAFLSYGPQIPAQPVSELELVPPRVALLRMSSGRAWACGSGLLKYPEYFSCPIERQGPPGAPELILAAIVSPSFESLRLLARHADYLPRDLEPLYARSCDAEENLEEIAAKSGAEPTLVRAEFERLINLPPEDI